MIKEYHWTQRRNFGDLLTPLLIDRFIHLPYKYAPPPIANLVMVGSILEHIKNLPTSFEGIIVGIGKLHEQTKFCFPHAKILALRGPLTAKGDCGSRRDIVFGDPGLLADELISPQEKQYDLGLVAHWTDKTLVQNPIFKKYNPLIINVADDPLKVIAQIAQCKKIVSSSLHGIILADALGIPRRIEIPPMSLSHPQREGGLFKWKDYSASINMKLEIGITQEPDRNLIIEKQHELFDVFEEVHSIFA